MNVTQKVEVHFHQTDRLSVIHSSGTNAEADEQFGEIALTIYSTMKVLGNLGASKLTAMVAQVLIDGDRTIPVFANGSATGGFEFLREPAEAKRRITATIKLTESNVTFRHRNRGFGLLSRGLQQSAAISTLALIRYFAIKRADDQAYLSSLATAAVNCGKHAAFRKKDRLAVSAEILIATFRDRYS